MIDVANRLPRNLYCGKVRVTTRAPSWLKDFGAPQPVAQYVEIYHVPIEGGVYIIAYRAGDEATVYRMIRIPGPLPGGVVVELASIDGRVFIRRSETEAIVLEPECGSQAEADRMLGALSRAIFNSQGQS